MQQASNYTCTECGTPINFGESACSGCSAAAPKWLATLNVDYYGKLQAPGRARLTLIRSSDPKSEGVSYLLQGERHVAGRAGAQIAFPDDAWVSAKHANFFYDNGQLVVHDEGSKNGVFVRLREPVALDDGGMFLCGRQVFRVDAVNTPRASKAPDSTLYYSAPKSDAAFKITHLYEGGEHGTSRGIGAAGLKIGRKACDLNFPEDVHMSPVHAELRIQADRLWISDLGSRNGTFVRIKKDHALHHGDLLFIGHEVLRVDMTS